MVRLRISSLVAGLLVASVCSGVKAQDRPETEARLARILERLDQSERESRLLRDEVEKLRGELTEPQAAPVGVTLGADGLMPALLQEQAPSESADDRVELGRQAFQDSCTQCHEASRALNKRKNLSAWRATVQRMARKRGAGIPATDVEPIARYLASLNPSAMEAPSDTSDLPDSTDAAEGGLSIYATLAPVWRGGAPDNSLENEGFFPETWIGAEWHSDSPLGGRVVACTSCHRGNEPGSRIELVEGTISFDIDKFFCGAESGVQAGVEAGRFVVPFGAVSSRGHPGAYRTATKSLMYNMGHNVHRREIGPPILPMPFSDEGALVNLALPLYCDVTATLEAYLSNGLQGSTSGVDFFLSRDYVDNNSTPAVGGRVTVGNSFIRLGSSIMSGRFNNEAGSQDRTLNYEIFGADLSIRHKDLIRLQIEYALRNSDRLLFLPGKLRDDEEVDGLTVEGELQICSTPRIGLVARYDSLNRNGDLAPIGSSLVDTKFNLHRVTWGFTFTLPGGSLLLINHEYWALPDPLESVDVVAVRWVATY